MTSALIFVVLRAQMIVPKAGKADIWRLAIIYQYGGIYADSDVKATYAFRDFVWPNASVVSGLGSKRDFHQWCVCTNTNTGAHGVEQADISCGAVKHRQVVNR
jgi:hypothetical protein